MENEKLNQMSASNDLKDVTKMFEQYDSQTKNSSNSSNSGSEESVLAKYFMPRNNVEKFRILPPLEGRNIIEHAFFHRVQVNLPNGKKRWRKVYCPEHNSPKVPKLDADGNPIKTQEGKVVMVNQKCPLCEKARSLQKKLDPSLKGVDKTQYTDEQKRIAEKNKEIYSEINKWKAHKFHIVRGIDKGAIKDGVKFWRFKDSWRKEGVLDKLMPQLKMYVEAHGKNPTSVTDGCDLYINVNDAKLPNGSTYKNVTTITPMQPSKIIDDDMLLKSWLNDKTTWRDVFKEASMTKVLTPTEYLERIAKGTDPYWDDSGDKKQYVFPDPADSELMKKANERSESLGAAGGDNFEKASDVNTVISDSYNVTINNVTSEDVGGDVDDSVDVGKEFANKADENSNTSSQESQEQKTVESSNDLIVDGDDEFDVDDLPF